MRGTVRRMQDVALHWGRAMTAVAANIAVQALTALVPSRRGVHLEHNSPART